ncbi:hypothetical protein SAMN05216562_0643 [Microbulbifer marinus]|uniref:Uncharacterized protein n=1 Tax=Microbulbifer marinus TaxID=658218 RepID=A0A1H3W8J6_9GAMM|nr:hypothetical protein SAMN05216562_0643 [Microbulbifer marinus]
MDVNFVRLVLDRSFGFPVTISLNLDTNELCVESLSLVQTQGYRQGDSRMKVLVDDQFATRVREEVSAFLLAPKQPPARFGLDGTTWKLEIQWHGHHHTSEQWCPESGGEFDIGTLLLERANKYTQLGSIC